MEKLQKISDQEIVSTAKTQKNGDGTTNPKQEKLAVTVKEPKKAPSPPPAKQYFTVVVEATAPVTLTYRVLADNPEQAIELLRNAPMAAPPKPQLNKMKKHKANVYMSGTSIIKLTKNF